MRISRYTGQFKKDLFLAKKRHKDIAKIKQIMALLIEGQSLPEKHKDHPLKGELKDYRECHIEPDWLLIYLPFSSEIHFIRTGTHSDLFG